MLRIVLLTGLVALASARVAVVKPRVPMYDGRIVGGVATTIEDLPYQVSFQRYGSHICGGSVLTSRFVITAAHCTDGSSASSFSVRAGSSIRGSGGTVHQVASVCQHPNFNYFEIDYDVTVLLLSSSILLGNPSLPVSLVASEPNAGILATVSGWGTLSSGGSLPSQLQRVDVPIVSRRDCRARYGENSITGRMICAGYTQGGKDSCQGDSGGPLAVNSVQVGIVSWGAGCAAPNYPGVYTNIADSSIRNHILQCANKL